MLVAVAALQGDQATLRADFRTIGDYFAENGGRAALDAFMTSSFTDEQLRAFPPPVDGLRQDPVAQELPDSVTAALADLKGEQSSLTVDITTMGDYFKDHGGRQALHTFLKAALSADQVKGLPLTGESLISAGATEVGRGALHDMPAFQ